MANREAVLGVISFGPQSGYDIQQELKGAASWIWRLSCGSVYPLLERLATEGLISAVEVQEGGRGRRVHELTGKGWRVLEAWLRKPPGLPIPVNDELMLQLLFWGTVLPDDRDTLIAHLRRREAEVKALLGLLDVGATATDEYQGLLDDYVRIRLGAELDWIAKAVTQLEGPMQPPRRDPHGIFAQAAERKAMALRAERAGESE